MTTTTLYPSVDRIAARAVKLDPVRVLIAVICAPLVVLFWVARFVWLAVALLLAAGMEGWTAADRQIEARRTDPQAR